MTCLFGTPGHTDLDILPIRLSIRKDVQLACAGCRAYMAERCYLRVVDRRLADLPVAEDRRLRRPAWLANLTNVDRTGLVR